MSRKDKIRGALYDMPPHQLVRAWNRYQFAINGTDIIYSMQSDFNNIISSLLPMEIVKLVSDATKDGLFGTCDNYFYCNPERGELYSFDYPDDLKFFNFESLASYIVSANDDIGIPSLQKILNEPGISKNEVIKNLCEKMPHELVDEWNDYQKRINSHEIIMSMEDDFNSVLKDFTPYELASLIGGSIQMRYFNPDSVYFYYDSIHNKLYSFDDPGDIYFFSLEELAKHIVTMAE